MFDSNQAVILVTAFVIGKWLTLGLIIRPEFFAGFELPAIAAAGGCWALVHKMLRSPAHAR